MTLEVDDALAAMGVKRQTPAPAKTIALPLQGTAKSSHPDFKEFKAYLRKDTQKAAKRKAEDELGMDFSELVQKLLEKFLAT